MEQKLTHVVRLGLLREKPYLTEEFISTYTALLCNANLVVTFGSGVGTLIRQCVGRGSVSGYSIDPMTHVLNISRDAILNDKGVVKPGIRKLLAKYGVSDETVSALPIDISEFDKKISNDFVDCVLDFQMNCIRDTVFSDREYIEYASNAGADLATFDPGILIAPYLFVDATKMADQTLDLNKSLYLASRRSSSGRLGAYLMVHQNVLQDEGFRSEIVRTYKSLSPDVLFLWVTRLNEHKPVLQRPARNRLRDAYALVTAMLNCGVPIVRVYSSFYAHTLRHDRMLGTSHGPGYGEYRHEIPVGGGVPVPMFYMPRLHKRVRFLDAERFIRASVKSSDEYFERICKCPTCVKVIGETLDNFRAFGETRTATVERVDKETKRVSIQKKEYASPQSIQLSTQHYMFCKHGEIQSVEGVSREQVKSDMLERYQEFQSTPLKDDAKHLVHWAED